ncbi:hypothetical protein EVAR_45432_1 [Eumeta japonica]|uniref:Uncharacterized protein n=1 Tax=Eumeta variegata TaxID=151549 RepID=A0A4C1ZKB8_EUMVA|nr:hypothetical protein EVAR_45432_1 [Eumeta japonica]
MFAARGSPVIYSGTVQRTKLCRSELPANDAMRGFNTPRPFPLHPRIPNSCNCDAFVTNFAAAEFQALYSGGSLQSSRGFHNGIKKRRLTRRHASRTTTQPHRPHVQAGTDPLGNDTREGPSPPTRLYLNASFAFKKSYSHDDGRAAPARWSGRRPQLKATCCTTQETPAAAQLVTKVSRRRRTRTRGEDEGHRVHLTTGDLTDDYLTRVESSAPCVEEQIKLLVGVFDADGGRRWLRTGFSFEAVDSK